MNALYVANALKHIFHASFHALQVSAAENRVTALEAVRHLRTVCCKGSNSRLDHTCHVSLLAFPLPFAPPDSSQGGLQPQSLSERRDMSELTQLIPLSVSQQLGCEFHTVLLRYGNGYYMY